MFKIKLSICVFIVTLALGFFGIALTHAADFSGNWQGSWTSIYGVSGGLSASITQSGNNLSGILSVSNTECGDFNSLPLSGTVSGSIASFQSYAYCAGDGSDNELRYADAIVYGNTMTGVYTTYSDGEFYDSGVFSLTQTSSFPSDRSSVEAFVTRFYQECLGRNPEPVGLNGWANALINGTLAGDDVAYGFIFSDEFIAKSTSNGDYLLVLYRAFFDRYPDPPGWNGWLGLLESAGLAGDEVGEVRSTVLDGFLYSQEFADLCNSFGINPY